MPNWPTGEERAGIDQMLADMELVFTPQQPGQEGSAICASFRREERLQYRFMMIFQSLVAVLHSPRFYFLVGILWQLWRGVTIGTFLQGAGAVVTGVAAGWLEKQRRDARLAFKAAQRGLEKHKC